jgi:DNA-binding NtrC family response regulator
MFSETKRSILIVDNDKSILRVFRRILEKKGYRVATTETGEEAAQKLQVCRFNASLIDIELPDIECTDLLLQTRKIAPRIVKIIFKGLPKLEESIEDYNCNEEVFLEKPVHPGELLKILDRKLGQDRT